MRTHQIDPSVAIETLDAIAAVLDGQEWSSSTTDRIAELMREAGFVIRDPADMGDDA